MAIVSSISGVRFTIDEFSHNFINKYAYAFSTYIANRHLKCTSEAIRLLPEKFQIIIGRDGRPSGDDIAEILADSLSDLGWEIILLDIVPTPTVQLFVQNSNAIGGIVITASHNPKNWNGLKFINHNGIFLNADENNELWKYLENSPNDYSPELCSKSEITHCDTAIAEQIDNIITIPFISSQLEKINKYFNEKNYSFVVDAVNSSGSVAVVKLLQCLGCDVVPLFCEGNGNFPHIPEPLAENLTEICDYIKLKKDDRKYIGIAVDPDADRLVLIDEAGDFIGEEKTICLAIESYFALNSSIDNSQETVVVNLSTTMLADKIANKHNAKIERSAVGEINVVEKMKKCNAVIGGEGSGGVILPECHYGRDSLVGITLLVGLLSKRRQALKQIVDDFPKFEMVKYKQNFSGNKEDFFDKILKKYSLNSISQIDGIKIVFENSWVQVRMSNTEPIFRIISESSSQQESQKLIDNILNVI